MVNNNIINHLKEVAANSVPDVIPLAKKPDLNIITVDVLEELFTSISKVNFEAVAGLSDGQALKQKHYLIITISELLKLAEKQNLGLTSYNGSLYVYNCTYWQSIEEPAFKQFLGQTAKKMGVYEFDADYHKFKDELLKQFESSAYLKQMKKDVNTVKINLLNGTFEITDGKRTLRIPRPGDFMTYRLPFEYDVTAEAPKFMKFLNEVLPEKSAQDVLAEYIASVFVRHIKFEKMLVLFGSGANGKSVVFEIVSALLGEQNISSYTLEDLTRSEYTRAMIADKLLNYASEISPRLDPTMLKSLASGEPIGARLPYKEPFVAKNYAKLMSNTNKLPSDVEITSGFFRRFLIIPFRCEIPEERQDKELAKKIISNELSGIFNWVLKGLDRILTNKRYSQCDIIEEEIEAFMKESDSVRMFIDDEEYAPSSDQQVPLKEIYSNYRGYCIENGYKACSNREFSKRLQKMKFHRFRSKYGWNILAIKK